MLAKKTIYINNNAEFLLDTIPEPEVIQELEFLHKLGDRSALWQGENKLLVTSKSIPHLDYWQELFGLPGLINVWPFQPSVSICDDIFHDASLQNQILSFCEGTNTIELIPYGTTIKFLYLANHLKPILRKSGVALVIPESPEIDNLWLVKYFSTKAGFRHLISEWFGHQLPGKLPEGYILNDYYGIISAIQSFLISGRGCVCKPSAGTSGLGQIRFLPESTMKKNDIQNKLESKPYMWQTPIVVEELIQPVFSPSGEAFVPKRDSGKVKLTYNCTQIFTKNHYFDGVLIDRDQFQNTIEHQINNCLTLVGEKLQSMGYAGIFDLDFIVDRNNTLFLLEANLRRTGGTHVHETAVLLFGDKYLEKRTVVSANANLPNAMNWDVLITRIESILFPMEKLQEGVIITKTSFLPNNIGYLVFGKDLERVNYLTKSLWELLKK